MSHEPEYLHATGKTFDEVLDAEIDEAERWLVGKGFVLVSHEDTDIDNVLRRHCRIGKVEPREVWPGIEDDVRELERLLTCTP